MIMKKIKTGKLELQVSKADAVDKLRQMKGVCSEALSGDMPREFRCSKSGKILIGNMTGTYAKRKTYMALFGKVIEESGKAYVDYCTTFGNGEKIADFVFSAIDIIVAVVALVFAVINKSLGFELLIVALCLVILILRLSFISKAKQYSLGDSDTLVKELKTRVASVNNWDK